MTDVLVSIVIPTKNEASNLEACLQSIQNQTYQNIEIIVIDNFSSDTTLQIAKKYTSNVWQKGPERSTQRNFGLIDKAQGIYAMFIDADMTLSPDLITTCVNCMQSKNCLGLHIPEIITGQSYWSKVRRFERSFYDGTVIDGVRFFRKETFVNVGGFDQIMTGPEDWDLDKKLKQLGKIELLPDNHERSVIYHNEAEFNLIKYIKKKLYYTTSFDDYINKWGKNDDDIRMQFGLWYRYFGVYLEHGKWQKFISNPHLVIGMYFLRFLVGLAFLYSKCKI